MYIYSSTPTSLSSCRKREQKELVNVLVINYLKRIYEIEIMRKILWEKFFPVTSKTLDAWLHLQRNSLMLTVTMQVMLTKTMQKIQLLQKRNDLIIKIQFLMKMLCLYCLHVYRMIPIYTPKQEGGFLKRLIRQQIWLVFNVWICKSSSVNTSNVFLNYLRNPIFTESWPILSGRHARNIGSELCLKRYA
jgi:hypothetical protein